METASAHFRRLYVYTIPGFGVNESAKTGRRTTKHSALFNGNVRSAQQQHAANAVHRRVDIVRRAGFVGQIYMCRLLAAKPAPFLIIVSFSVVRKAG